MGRTKNWDKSRRSWTDSWGCWHCLYLFQGQRDTAVGKQGWELQLLSGLWCQSSSMALFCILLNGTGLGAQVDLSYSFPDWDYPATALPAQPHCQAHGCPRAVVQTKATLPLRTSFSIGTMFRTESRVMYWVYFSEALYELLERHMSLKTESAIFCFVTSILFPHQQCP